MIIHPLFSDTVGTVLPSGNYFSLKYKLEPHSSRARREDLHTDAANEESVLHIHKPPDGKGRGAGGGGRYLAGEPEFPRVVLLYQVTDHNAYSDGRGASPQLQTLACLENG